jgi:hypothetical protein
MPGITTRRRVQKIDEAKEIIAELEAKKEMRLSAPRGALHKAGNYIDSDRTYFERMEDAMGRTAGLAVEGGYDEVAADASQLVTDLQENVLNGE